MALAGNASDMIDRYDSETLGMLVTDDGNPVSEAHLPNSGKMTAALDGAKGDVVAACLRGERYARTDLEALTGESLAYLKDIVCAFAFWRLWKRKPYHGVMDDRRQAAQEDYSEALEMLATGQRVFEVDDVMDAGRPNIDSITRSEIDGQWELITDRARGRFYPRRRSFQNR